jgi:hypothetical protein
VSARQAGRTEEVTTMDNPFEQIMDILEKMADMISALSESIMMEGKTSASLAEAMAGYTERLGVKLDEIELRLRALESPGK